MALKQKFCRPPKNIRLESAGRCRLWPIFSWACVAAVRKGGGKRGPALILLLDEARSVKASVYGSLGFSEGELVIIRKLASEIASLSSPLPRTHSAFFEDVEFRDLGMWSAGAIYIFYSY